MVAFSKPREVDNNIQGIINEIKNRIELAQSCEDDIFKDSFKKMSLNDKQQILEKVSSYYNELIVTNEISGARLVRGDRVNEGVVRYKCCNQTLCSAGIWINKKGQLRDTLHQHHSDCFKSQKEDSGNTNILINAFISSNKEAYDRALYHLAVTKAAVRNVTYDNLYQLFIKFMKGTEGIQVDPSFRDRLGRKLYREVDAYVHDGKKREYQVETLIQFFDLNPNDFIYYIGKENTIEGENLLSISWIDKRFDHLKKKNSIKFLVKM